MTYLHTTWFAWYAQEPYWTFDAPKQQRSNAKYLFGFMKVFLGDCFVLGSRAADYRDRVLTVVKQADAAVLSFLSNRKIKSREYTAVRKHF